MHERLDGDRKPDIKPEAIERVPASSNPRQRHNSADLIDFERARVDREYARVVEEELKEHYRRVDEEKWRPILRELSTAKSLDLERVLTDDKYRSCVFDSGNEALALIENEARAQLLYKIGMDAEMLGIAPEPMDRLIDMFVKQPDAEFLRAMLNLYDKVSDSKRALRER